ncbi:MAG: NosD domain-containing protein [Terriglobales bacterium]
MTARLKLYGIEAPARRKVAMCRGRFITVLVTTMFLNTLSFAGTYVAYAVGSTSCDKHLVGYQTIQAAVNAVPSGSTIEVCPGIYPEQVVISKPLTLTAFTVAASEASNAEVLIQIPAGGATGRVYDGIIGNIYSQILVSSTGPVNIADIAFDGTGNNIPDGWGNLAAVFYEESSGTVNGVSVANEIDDGGGMGIVAAANTIQTVTVENSDFRSFDCLGIWGATNTSSSLTLNVKSNTISDTGANGVYSGTDGVYLLGSVSGTIESNLVNGSGNGFSMVLDGSAATITANTIIAGTIDGPPNSGIEVNGGANTVKGNRILSGPIGVGIVLTGTATGGSVTGNTITGGSGGYGIDMCGQGTASGFTVTGNTIVDTPGFGLRMPASGNKTAPNTYYVDGATPVVVGC